jgi:hypothetical protein
MSRGFESILVTKQETVILLKAKPIIVEGLPMAIRVKYSEPIFNQRNGNIVKGVPRDWSKKIHSANIIPKPNPPCCTYCH